VLTLGGVTVVDDAYNANPASMSAAIDALSRAGSGRRVLVMGDMLELGSRSASLHARAVTAVFEKGIDVLVAVGPAVARAIDEAGRGDVPTHVVECENATEATDNTMAVARPGDTVWVKGSRAVKLDRVVRGLEARFGTTEPKASPSANTRRSDKAGGMSGKARQSADVKTG
jgi:UDP-N-acetylmuramoyl-tripeptide--D-alanyl-D-alanine ligase